MGYTLIRTAVGEKEINNLKGHIKSNNMRGCRRDGENRQKKGLLAERGMM